MLVAFSGISIEPVVFRIELDREVDGRWMADIPELPGVGVYGETYEEALAKVKSLALSVFKDRITEEYWKRERVMEAVVCDQCRRFIYSLDPENQDRTPPHSVVLTKSIGKGMGRYVLCSWICCSEFCGDQIQDKKNTTNIIKKAPCPCFHPIFGAPCLLELDEHGQHEGSCRYQYHSYGKYSYCPVEHDKKYYCSKYIQHEGPCLLINKAKEIWKSSSENQSIRMDGYSYDNLK